MSRLDTSADPAAMVRKETIANTCATAVIAALLSWAIFRGESPIDVLAPPVGGILGIVPGTFNFTLLVTLVLTLIVRRRVRRGQYPRLTGRDAAHVGSRLPRNLLLRALLLAVIATLVFVPVSIFAVWVVTDRGWLSSGWPFAGMLSFFVAYFALLSLVVTPIVVWRALGD